MAKEKDSKKKKVAKSKEKETKKTAAKAAKKREKKEVPLVLRADSMVDVMKDTILSDDEAPEDLKKLTKKELRYLLDLVNATIWKHVAAGGKVQFMPYITYYGAVRLPRKGRNPRTGEEIMIKGSRSFAIRQGKALKDLMNADQELVQRLIKEKMEERKAKEAAKAAKAKKKAKKSA